MRRLQWSLLPLRRSCELRDWRGRRQIRHHPLLVLLPPRSLPRLASAHSLVTPLSSALGVWCAGMVGVGDDVAVEVKKHHLRLAFACEGGGGGDMRMKREKKTTSGSLLRAREVVVVTCR